MSSALAWEVLPSGVIFSITVSRLWGLILTFCTCASADFDGCMSCSGYSQDGQHLSWRSKQGPAFVLAERQFNLSTEAVASPGLTVCSHSSAALRARGCIFGKEFVALMERSIASPTPLACPAHSQRSFLLSLRGCEHTALTECCVLKVRSGFLSLYWYNFCDKVYFH